MTVQRKMIQFALVFVMFSHFANAELVGDLDRNILAAGANRIFILSSNGDILWKHPAQVPCDVQMLPNGNILFADGNIHEVTRDHQEVFTYRPKIQANGATYSCRRLPNGNTLVSENGSGKIIELDSKGKQVFSFQTEAVANVHPHSRLRCVRKTAKGTYLVAHAGAKFVREYNAKGEIIWEVKTPKFAFLAERLPNGNTMVSSMDQVTEYRPDQTIAWEFKNTDLPGVEIRNMSAFQVLPNGNLLIGCYSAYRNGKGTGMLEITRGKKCVWRYISPNFADSSHMGVEKIK